MENKASEETVTAKSLDFVRRKRRPYDIGSSVALRSSPITTHTFSEQGTTGPGEAIEPHGATLKRWRSFFPWSFLTGVQPCDAKRRQRVKKDLLCKPPIFLGLAPEIGSRSPQFPPQRVQKLCLRGLVRGRKIGKATPQAAR